jgi:hypothetical protein
MDSPQRWEKLIYAKLGEFIAEVLAEEIIASFNCKKLTWFNSSFKNLDKSILLEEWIFFNMLGITRAIGDNFEYRQGGFVLNRFKEVCGVIFTKAGIFNKPSVFIKLFDSRFDMYLTEIESRKIKNPKHSIPEVVSRKFCEICGVGDKVISVLSLSTYYKDTIIANNDLIGDLLRGT